MLFSDSIDVAVDVFGGYCPAIPPSDLPPGAASIAQDVSFPMGGVRSRGGLRNAFSVGSPIPANASINGLKSWITSSLSQRLLVWDSLSNLYKENPQGTLTLIGSRPYANLRYNSTSLFGREYQAFFDINGGKDIPRQYDDTYWDRVSQSGPGASPTVADSGTAGNIPIGNHQVSVAFITRQGFITQASPPVTWAAGGSKQVTVSNIPIGPSNVVARLILFTPVITAPATTGSFYSLPNGTTQLATPTKMLINDNTTAITTLDFSDTILQAGFSANYLFTQLELGESAFVTGYNSRLCWLGERNHISNLINLGFDGGFTGGGGSANSTNSPSVATTTGGDKPWTNPGNVFAADGVLAVASLIPVDGGVTGTLNATGYGFAIPSNATIVGIKVQALVKTSGTGVTDLIVKLLKAGVAVGTGHQNGNAWTTVLANQTYGSSSDLWGTTWTPTDINAATFGISYSAINNDLTHLRTASIDYISIQVYYTTPATGGPSGWTQGAAFAGGASATSGGFSGDWVEAYAITGDGATAKRGEINQSAYKDYLLVDIIARNTAYGVRVRVAKSGTLTQGTLHINLVSASGAFTTPGLSVQGTDLTAAYQEFDAVLTTAIVSPPTDLLLQVYVDGTPDLNGVFLVDSIEIYPTSIPFNYSTARFSHSFNPESYDGTTGQVQIRPNNGQQLRAGFPLRSNLYLAKDHYLCYVTDDGVNEPASWAVNEVSATIGICGPNACDWTEEWAAFAERSGLYVIWGGDPVKISQEISHDASGTGLIAWDSINWQYGHTIWVRIDQANKQILVGAPIDGATSPNIVFVVDYKWLSGAQDMADDPMVTYSAFSGKILAHGKGRRWSLWSIVAPSMCLAERSDGTVQPFFGNGHANGKVYQQYDCALQPSDDGAAVPWMYQTYAVPSTIDEQMLRLGSYLKLAEYMSFRAIGSGAMGLAVSTAARAQILRSYNLYTVPIGDGERPLNMKGERFYITIRANNSPTSWFQLEKLVLSLKQNATFRVRGAAESGGTIVAGGASVSRYTVTGTINGVNITFTLPSVPNPSSLQLFRNGVLQSSPGDYSIAGATITFTSAPLVGDILVAYY